MLFHQCRLRQGNAYIVGWIEARGAKLGALVEVPECGGLWRVETVCPQPISGEALREKQRVDRRGMPDI